jgi:hypothetical protein
VADCEAMPYLLKGPLIAPNPVYPQSHRSVKCSQLRGAVKVWGKPRFAQVPVSGTIQVHRGALFIRLKNAPVDGG